MVVSCRGTSASRRLRIFSSRSGKDHWCSIRTRILIVLKQLRLKTGKECATRGVMRCKAPRSYSLVLLSAMMKCVIWRFGRGASIACNLTWTVPENWLKENPPDLTAKIKTALLGEMSSPEIDPQPYKKLLQELAHRTSPPWQR